jgi:hypothetical protein
MSVRKRAAAVAAATMMSVGVVLAGAPAASAAPVQAGAVSTYTSASQGPFYSYSECLTTQNEFRRYYTILRPCHYVTGHFYWFGYDSDS